MKTKATKMTVITAVAAIKKHLSSILRVQSILNEL